MLRETWGVEEERQASADRALSTEAMPVSMWAGAPRSTHKGVRTAFEPMPPQIGQPGFFRVLCYGQLE